MLIDAGLRRYVCNGQKPAWQRDGEECLLYPGAFNRSVQHFL
jgi:hypothetical protein